MLSRQETIVWRRLERLEEELTAMAAKLLFLEGQVRARLKEEADARKMEAQRFPFSPFGLHDQDDD